MSLICDDAGMGNFNMASLSEALKALNIPAQRPSLSQMGPLNGGPAGGGWQQGGQTRMSDFQKAPSGLDLRYALDYSEN